MSIKITFDGPPMIITPYIKWAFKANHPVELGTRELTVDLNGTITTVNAEIVLRLSPSPLLIARFPTLPRSFGGLMFFAGGVSYKIWVTDRPDIECQVLDIQDGYTIVHFLGGTFASKPHNRLSSVTFHLINFTDYIGTWYRDGESSYAGRVVFKNKRWRFTIDESKTTFQLLNDLSRTGGFAITHVGMLERTDGKTFQSKSAIASLNDLAEFLCFAMGDWSTPVLMTGFDKSGKEVWYDWSVRRFSSWKQTMPWWHGQEIDDILPKIFPRFMKLLSDKSVWGDSLRSMMYWYAYANVRTGGTNGAIMLLQAALEKLAWTYLVLDRSILTGKKFDGQSLAKNLKELLAQCSIPETVPHEFIGLLEFSSVTPVIDGPSALVQVRNSLVHPSNEQVEKRTKLTGKPVPYLEALHLGLEYFERIVLYLCRYRGPYRRRHVTPFRDKAIEIR